MSERDGVTFADWTESICQLEGWQRVAESHRLARLIDKGEFDDEVLRVQRRRVVGCAEGETCGECPA